MNDPLIHENKIREYGINLLTMKVSRWLNIKVLLGKTKTVTTDSVCISSFSYLKSKQIRILKISIKISRDLGMCKA